MYACYITRLLARWIKSMDYHFPFREYKVNILTNLNGFLPNKIITNLIYSTIHEFSSNQGAQRSGKGLEFSMWSSDRE